jgi:hypothetical protein
VKKIICLLGMLILMKPQVMAWQPAGWVYANYPYMYDHATRDWYWFSPNNTQWANGFPPADGWKRLNNSALAQGWTWHIWPYAYNHPTRAWHFFSANGQQHCVNLRTGTWSMFGTVLIPVVSGTITRHPPTRANPYAFYTYFPRSLSLPGAVTLCVWPHGGGASSNDYAYHEGMAYDQINRLRAFSERYKLPILVVAIPRVIEIYVHSLHPDTFTTTDAMLRRPDLKLIDAVWNQYIPSLESLGCVVSGKVLMMGFSSPGMFTHRFAMLHPHRVKAVWVGGEAPAPVCADRMFGRDLEYPVGTYNWASLVGQPFQYDTYKGIPHFVVVGQNDTNPNNDTTTYTDIFTESQRLFIRANFGDTNPKRIKFYADHLASIHVPTTFKQYDGLAHEPSDAMMEDAFKFLSDHR